MKKLFLYIFLIIPSLAHAGVITIPTVYQTGGSVTAPNLNGNFTAVTQVVNGGLDNTNANTTSGYRFFQTVSALPSAANQGAVYFLTTDNTLNFDTGGSYVKSVTISGTPARGDIIYYNGTAWVDLAAGTSGQALLTQGAGANPQWATVVPSGVIVMWSGTIATIPSGWVLCNGSNSTPDLRNLFVVGANADSGGVAKSTITGSALQTGGSTTIAIGNIPTITVTATGRSAGGDGPNFGTSANGGATETLSTNSFGSGTAYTQPFYALAYIMKI